MLSRKNDCMKIDNFRVSPVLVVLWFQVIPGHGNPQKGGQCLVVIYSNIVALNTRLFTRYVKRHPSKKINTKKVT